jgi:predicted dehydrogenase
MEPVRLGVVGCGVIGSRHVADAERAGVCEVVAVADRVEGRARAVAEKHGVAQRFAEGSELIARAEVEAVVLAVPTGVRTALARQALAAGKHVLLEKPAAMSAQEVRELMGLQGDRVVATCSSRFRTLESAGVITGCIAQGTLGELRVVRARSISAAAEAPSSPPPLWRQSRALNGGGILVNWGIYDLDYLLGITGWRLVPAAVFAQTWPIAPHLSARVAPGSDADSHFLALIRCQGGTMISLERGEFASTADPNVCQVIGEKGSLRMQMAAYAPSVVTLEETDSKQGVTARQLWAGEDDYAGTTRGVLADFAQAVREGRRPLTDLPRALVLQQITDAVYESAEAGREVLLARG